MAIKNILQEIGEFNKICIQSPSGLKKDALKLSDKLKEKGKKVILISEASFGACDLADERAKKLGCDCLIHLGHSPFYKNGEKLETEIPVFYYEKRLDWDVKDILKRDIEEINEEKIGIVATVQHLHKIHEAKEILEDHDKKVTIGKKGRRTQRKGQILGCDSSSAERIQDKVEVFLVVASGRFHALKVLDTEKKVYRLDPLEGRIEVLDREVREKREKKRISRVMKHKDEKKWGIIVSTKKGQFQPELVMEVNERLESLSKEVYTIAGDSITEEDLIDYGLKVFVNTACPRLTEDFEEVSVINPQDLKFMD